MSTTILPPVGGFRVPDELMKLLHEGTRRFVAARRQLEDQLSSPGSEHPQRPHMTGELREAQIQLEEAHGKIHEFFKRA